MNVLLSVLVAALSLLAGYQAAFAYRVGARPLPLPRMDALLWRFRWYRRRVMLARLRSDACPPKETLKAPTP